MKTRLTKKFVAVTLGALLTTPTFANETWISIGSPTKSSGGGTSLSLGGKISDRWGIGVGIVFNSDYTDSEVLDYPVPHTDYRSLGKKRVGNSYGLDAFYFLTDAAVFRPYFGIGLYRDNRKTLAQSNATNWIYTQDEGNGAMISGELGAQVLTNGGLIWGISAHTIRGVSVTIGKRY